MKFEENINGFASPCSKKESPTSSTSNMIDKADYILLDTSALPVASRGGCGPKSLSQSVYLNKIKDFIPIMDSLCFMTLSRLIY